jgi:hypothetical protein
MSTIARYFDADKDEGQGVHPGVPLGDITEDQWNQYPSWLQDSIDADPRYRKTKPATSTTRRARITEAADAATATKEAS